MNFPQPLTNTIFVYLLFFAGMLLAPASAIAEGTANLRTADGDPVMLFVGNPNFGNFAVYDGPETSRLNFRIAEAGEMVYIGLSRLYRSSGVPENNGELNFRIRSAETGAVVFGPFTVNALNENLSSFTQASIGPAALATGGYDTDASSSFAAPAAGEYFIEFEQVNGRPRYIGLWDITIANDGVRQSGRVYSRNWAFRVPELDPQLPECAFGAELSTKFYSYTSDGFVTEIDFTDSGFQPLSFTLAFNRTGPGQTGDLFQDRMSIANQNATDNVAEHLIFLEQPDADLFPDGVCGNVSVTGTLTCRADDTYCIPVNVSEEGQVEIVMDFNGNGVYDEDIDRLLLYRFTQERGFDACVEWDGLMADGNRPAEGSTVDLLVSYIQGVQHWALYDGELMRNGFCVTPVRPICGNAGPAPLHYDDINIPDDPGNGNPKRVLEGCDCATVNCRTWTNFQANAAANCAVNNDLTTGYGDKNTLNTWWFAASQTTTSFEVPIDAVTVSGPAKHCPGAPVELKVSYASINDIGGVRWTGPSGPLPAGDDLQQFTVTETGVYTVLVIDEFGCESNGSFTLMDVTCALDVTTTAVTCDDNGTATDPADDTWTTTLLVAGNNSNFFVVDGVNYPYGTEVTLGPFPIANGPITITAADSEFTCCAEVTTIDPPLSCSDGCAITSGIVLGTSCTDPGTPTDPSDDTFTFDMTIDGVNLGPGWGNDEGSFGSYGEVVTYGPYNISAGNVAIRFTDTEHPDCIFNSVVQPPMACSNECELSMTTTNAVCNDQGTPFDLTDDTYTFDLLVNGINTPSPAFQVNGSGAYLYGQTISVGPFPSFNSNYTFVITDVGGGGCTMTYTMTGADRPAGCTVPCSIEITDTRVVCEDQGTEDPEDDFYAVEILATSQDPAATGWTLGDDITGAYGEFARVGTILPGGADMQVTLFDQDLADCSATISVAAPALEVSCPEDVTTTERTMSRQQFAGSLTTAGGSIRADQEVCWIADETFADGRRYEERLTLRRAASVDPALRLFSFYLFAPVETELRGAVFNLHPDAAIDCCALSNDDPVTAEPTNASSLPPIPEELYPAGMQLQQRFSVALRPAANYSLLTSTRNANVTGDYAWMILSADGEVLSVERADAPDPVVSVDEISVVFDLLGPDAERVFNDVASLAEFGQPTLETLCGDLNLAFTDTRAGTCDRAQIQRRFSVDLDGTVLDDVCEQTLSFRGADIGDITWPARQYRFACRDTFPLNQFGFPDPDVTGFPWIYLNGAATALDSITVDGLVTDYADAAFIREDDGGTTIMRTWRIQDPCREATHLFQQTIKLENNGVPYFSCPISNHYCPVVEEDIMLWNTRPFDCVADVEIPEPELFNVCDSTGWTFTTDILRVTAAGDTVFYARLADDDRRLIGVQPGDYLIRYSGEHAQESMAERLCRFRVADLADPTALCRSTINLSLNGAGLVSLRLQTVDLGSYDNCAIDSLLIRRQLQDSLGFGAWTESFTTFDCNDVGLTYEVQLLAVDTAGNRNYCSSRVTVRDNTDPYCTGLDAVFVSCDSLPDDFHPLDTMQLRQLFGMPEVIDNCSARALELEPVLVGDRCMPDRIRRRFRAVDQNGNFSTGLYLQEINIASSLSYAIQLPRDTDTDCTDFSDTLRIVGSGCDSITYQYVDVFLPATGEECRYVQRNYLITNWCEWDGVSDPIAIGRDENCSGTEGDASVWLVRNPTGIYVDADSNATNNLPAASTVCDPGNPGGYYRQVTGQAGGRYTYAQRFRVFDATAPVLELHMLDTICVDTSLCRTDVTVGIDVFDACQVDEGNVAVAVDVNNNGVTEISSVTNGGVTGSFPNYAYTVNLPIGNHRMIFTVTDDCNNTVIVEREVNVYDCYVPVLTCREDRLYNLEALVEEGDVDMDGEIEEAAALVEAADLATCDFLDCSGNLNFSVNRVGEPADFAQTSMYLDCNDRYEVMLEVYVYDNAFNAFSVQPDGTVGGPNWRSCTVRVRLQDPDLACNNCQVENNISINGRVTSLSGAPLTDVTITTGRGETFTNNFGFYQVGGTVGEDYALRASRDADPRDGLSTLDLVILRRQLLGIAPFTTPFQRLAADLNRDGFVDLQDALLLQGIILGRRDYYPATSPWRFVPADWDGTGAPPAGIDLEAVAACGYNHDFVGLRLGDLNDSFGADAGAGTGGRSSGQRSARPEQLTATDREVRPGELVTLRLSNPNFSGHTGGQYALRWNTAALRYVALGDNSSIPNEQVRTDDGYLWTSWSDRVAGEALELTFRATAAGKLSDLLRLDDDPQLPGEAYGTNLNRHPLYLEWTAPATADTPTEAAGPITEVGATNEALGVLPNPARNFTRVGFQIASAQRARLIVTDLQGRRVLSATPRLAAGEQWLRVDVQDWPAGVYQLSLFTAEGVVNARVVRQ